MRILSIFLFIALVALSCTSDPVSNYKELNLLGYGLPISILAPDSAKVKKEDWGIRENILVSSGEGFDLLVWKADAKKDLPTIKADILAEVKSNRLFSKIIKEESNGFIFENKLDSNTLYYGFRYFKVQGDNLYNMENGLRGNFTQEQAEQMYTAVSTNISK